MKIKSQMYKQDDRMLKMNKKAEKNIEMKKPAE